MANRTNKAKKPLAVHGHGVAKNVDPTIALKENIARLEGHIKAQSQIISMAGERNRLLSNNNHATAESLRVERAELMARVGKIDMRLQGLVYGDARDSSNQDATDRRADSTMTLREWKD